METKTYVKSDLVNSIQSKYNNLPARDIERIIPNRHHFDNMVLD